MDKVRLSEPFNTTKPASIAKKDFEWSAVRLERNDPLFRCGVDLDEASPGIIAFAPKGIASTIIKTIAFTNFCPGTGSHFRQSSQNRKPLDLLTSLTT